MTGDFKGFLRQYISVPMFIWNNALFWCGILFCYTRII